MANEDFKIEDFVLRVPGLSEEEAGILGQDVAQQVADSLADYQNVRHLGALHLRVSVPHGTSRTDMSKVISEAILKGLI